MSVPADQMAPPDMVGPPTTGPSGIPPNLLPFPSTQPGGIEQLAGPLLAQQAIDLEAVKRQQLEAVMAVVMQHMAQMPNPMAQGAQTEPSPPMDGTQTGQPGLNDPMAGGGGPPPPPGPPSGPGGY